MQQKKKQKYLIGAALVFVLATIYVVWTGFLKKPEEGAAGEIQVAVSTSFPKNIKINFEVFKSPIFEQLQPFEDIQPLTEQPGRPNPFTPY